MRGKHPPPRKDTNTPEWLDQKLICTTPASFCSVRGVHMFSFRIRLLSLPLFDLTSWYKLPLDHDGELFPLNQEDMQPRIY